jgi:hypothetical protein
MTYTTQVTSCGFLGAPRCTASFLKQNHRPLAEDLHQAKVEFA